MKSRLFFRLFHAHTIFIDAGMSGGFKQADPTDRAAMIFVACIPLIYAAATWDHGASPELTGMRQFGYWSLLVAFCTIVVATLRTPSLIHAARSLPVSAKIAVFLTVIIAFISAQGAAYTASFAMMKTLVNLLILLFGLAFFAILSRTPLSEHRPIAEKVILCGFALYLATVIAYIATAPEDFHWAFFGMTAQNIRNLGSHMMTVAAFSVGMALVSSGKWQWVAVIIATIAIALLAWSGSRGSYSILLVMAVIAVIVFSAKNRGRNFVMVAAIFVVGSLLSLLHHVDHFAFGLDRILGLATQVASGDNVDSGRVAIWMRTIELLKVMPLWGYGDGQFIHIYDGPGRFAFPHNVLLQLWFQWGWIGGTLAIGLLAWLGLAAFKRTLADPDHCLPAFMILAVIGGYGMIDGPFYDTLPMLFFAIAAALCFAPMATSGQPPQA